MILEKQTEAIVHQDGIQQDSIGMSLDLDSAQMLMQMLSKSLYSDAIGSTIREWASNALDSHRKAGVTKPIVVRFRVNSSNNYEFSVEDFGTGLDADDVKNIISKYGKSTKRNSATELGMFGLGFKAGLAYSSSFYFVCRKNGMERKYMMYEGEELNTIDLLYEKPTTEPNGVKMILPVKYSDRREFVEKISEQLAYFESVYFDLEGFDNEFVIHRYEHFQFSPIATDGNMHICLDNVYYPLEFNKLGIDPIHLPIGLRFGLTDGLYPTPNRESIRYTKEAKEIILAKIRQAADYFISKYNESVVETDNIVEVMNYFSSDSRNLEFGKAMYDISSLEKHATISIAKPTLKGISVLNLQLLHRNKDYILGEYKVGFKLVHGKWRECKRSYDTQLPIKGMLNKHKHFIYSEKISGKKEEFIKQTYGGDTHKWGEHRCLIRKSSSFKLGNVNRAPDYATYVSILGLSKIDRKLWRTAIKEFQYIVGLYTDGLTNIDTLEVPQGWIDPRKKSVPSIQVTGTKVRKLKLKGEIVGKEAQSLERYVEGKNCKWVSTTYNLEKIYKAGYLTVYAAQTDDGVKLMDGLFKISKDLSSTYIRFVTFSDRELKNVEKIELHNWIKLDKFMEGKNKPFKRLVTAYLIDKLIDEQEHVFTRTERLALVSKSLVENLDTLLEYKKKNYNTCSEETYQAMLAVAEEHNLFDGEIYHTYKQVKSLLEKLYFLNELCSHMRRWSDDNDCKTLRVIADMFKYYKTRIDWKNYNVKLAEDELVKLTEQEMVEIV
jgi:hypothetical protein